MSMCDFNSLNEEDRLKYHVQLEECAVAFGGKNFFLQLLEAIRKSKTHPLMAKNSEFRFELGTVKWNKVIFREKLTLLKEIRLTESEDNTLIPNKEAKNYKKVMNLLRTIKPITFEVRPSDATLGDGFEVHPFEVIGENTTRLDPMFDALFFCSVDTIKKILGYAK